MWKHAGAGIVAIVLLGALNAKAGEADESHNDFQVGPVQVSVADLPTAAVAPEGDYWLGVACFPLPESLRSQLGLGEHEGLLVRQVVPESPAAKAGLRRDDVLVKVNGKTLASPEDLIQAINAGKDKKLGLELIRMGKNISVSLQPEKRPEHVAAKAEGAWGGEADWQALQGWLDHMVPGEGPPMQFHIFHPGVILPPGAPLYPNLPDNVTVTISKHGQKPAKITVHEGDKNWEVTEKDLDKLPKDVRPYVEQMLGPFGRGNVAFSRKGVAGFAAPWAGAPLPAPEAGPRDTRLQKRLDDMSRQIQDMQKSLEQMRQKNAPPTKPQAEKSKDQPGLRSDRT